MESWCRTKHVTAWTLERSLIVAFQRLGILEGGAWIRWLWYTGLQELGSAASSVVEGQKERRQAGRQAMGVKGEGGKLGCWAGDWPRPPVAPTTPASIDENQERQLLSASRIDNLTQPSCCSLRPESSDRWISGTARSNSINDPTRGGIGGTGLGYVYHAMPCPLRCAALR